MCVYKMFQWGEIFFFIIAPPLDNNDECWRGAPLLQQQWKMRMRARRLKGWIIQLSRDGNNSDEIELISILDTFEWVFFFFLFLFCTFTQHKSSPVLSIITYQMIMGICKVDLIYAHFNFCVIFFNGDFINFKWIL